MGVGRSLPLGHDARPSRDRDPLRAAAHNNFGIACYFAGRLAEAEAAFHRLLELSPGRAGAHYFLTRVLFTG